MNELLSRRSEDMSISAPTVAEWFLRSLIAHGCEAIFLNPGTDTPPLQEAWAKLKAEGQPVPELVLCPHEIIAVTAAQGYYLASGKPQVAFVHVDVGTANASGGLNDARASQIPVILCAGMSPVTTDSSIPGSRTKFINWLQDVPDQQALVRNYVKWSQVVSHPAAVCTAVDRAFQMAQSEPMGPVYLAFPRETMMEQVDAPLALGPDRSKPVKLPALDEATASALVDKLLAAENPLIITGYGGRSRAHRDAIVALAETLSAPVTEYRGRFNAPLDHPMHLGFNPERWVGDADLILVIDQDVAFVPADRKLRDDVTIVHMGPDPIQQNLTIWGFPADQVIPCNTLAGVSSLVAAARTRAARLTTDEAAKLDARRARAHADHGKMLADHPKTGDPARTNRITPFMVGEAMTDLCPEAQVYEEAVTSGNPFAYGFRPNEEGAYNRNGGSFLGWGLGAPLGAKLADREKLIATVVGDGSFMFGVPTAALWASRRHKLPLLIVVLNNACYNSVRLATRDSYPHGVQAADGYVGVDLIDPPAFEKLAESCGAWGERVETPADLRPRLREALDIVREGRTAVLNIIIEAAEKPL